MARTVFIFNMLFLFYNFKKPKAITRVKDMLMDSNFVDRHIFLGLNTMIQEFNPMIQEFHQNSKFLFYFGIKSQSQQQGLTLTLRVGHFWPKRSKTDSKGFGIASPVCIISFA